MRKTVPVENNIDADAENEMLTHSSSPLFKCASCHCSVLQNGYFERGHTLFYEVKLEITIDGILYIQVSSTSNTTNRAYSKIDSLEVNLNELESCQLYQITRNTLELSNYTSIIENKQHIHPLPYSYRFILNAQDIQQYTTIIQTYHPLIAVPAPDIVTDCSNMNATQIKEIASIVHAIHLTKHKTHIRQR